MSARAASLLLLGALLLAWEALARGFALSALVLPPPTAVATSTASSTTRPICQGPRPISRISASPIPMPAARRSRSPSRWRTAR